ncbi:gp53-like domain-containing protein [Pelosinus baikalensis]|uniref:Putative tail fiber protein gp53-like C-terminal domain-containing protein n=1 Tax=Pelosinus baikalensis TaxID=2892015 RepID=A0ABS8HTJ0_9FIRM|nr:hypothetical protein [Pelosinus baikalensis]MCC5465533.1 hypothetical protein [Pelosinus baikalensis]
MAYDANKPADNDFLADFPPQMREQLRSIIQDAIVNSGLLQGKSAGNGSGQIPVSNGVLNTGLNAERVGGLLASAFAVIAHVHSVATSSSNGFMSNTDFAKLAAIAAGAQVNQNAFSNISVNGVTIQADSPTDTLEVVAGTNIALTPDATNDRLTISVTGKVAAATAADTAAACTGNAATATRWAAARNLTLGGDCTGTVSIDGSGNMTLTVVVVDDSHNHLIANVDGLQTALDAKLAATGTAVNASKVGGFSPTTTSTASTVVLRDGSNDITTRLFRTEYTAGGGNCAYILGQNAIGSGVDNYARPIPLATLKAALGVTSIVESGGGTNYYWRKWSSGDIEIFGIVDAIIKTNGSITFPIAFPTACKTMVYSDTGYNGANAHILHTTTPTKTGFSYNWDGFGNQGQGNAIKIQYHAIGS